MITKFIINLFNEIKKQKILLENYIYLTVIQIVNTLFYFLIYPFSIKIFGASDYGLFLFSITIISYLTLFISFGIDLPALKILSQNINDRKIKSELLSDVVSTKFVLSFISSVVLIILMFLNPKLSKLLLVNSLQAFSSIFLLNWYFQGLQKMKWFVFFQLVIRTFSILLLFTLVKKAEDLILYSSIISVSVFLIAILSFCYLIYKEGLSIRFVKFDRIVKFIHVSYHFFLNSSISVVRSQSTTLFVGSYVGMNEVSYFDLASKVILLPQSIVSNINNALFPKILKSKEIDIKLVKKVFWYEFFIGVFFICLVVLFGRNVIQLFLHENIVMAHNLAIIMSITIMSWLLVGCIVNFVFIPINRYDLISKNQLIAFVSFFIFCFIGLFFFRSVYIVAFGIAFSALLEILFCFIMVVKLNFFKRVEHNL
ncbi:oligosaccharide flippase family protein [Flavobacterium sp.]|uniref:oligosaccharide flippase family protein n=1 Tax=Flavobacterium sp. TaxID=239 RepID=UPI0035AEDACC